MARLCSTRVGVVCFRTMSFMAASCSSMASVTGQGSLHLARYDFCFSPSPSCKNAQTLIATQIYTTHGGMP